MVAFDLVPLPAPSGRRATTDGGRFPYAILDVVAHRPWPLPRAPWLMRQRWHDLLFAHWPVDVSVLRNLVPAGLPLDLHGGRAWVGVVPFRMTNVAPRGVPAIPWLSAFPELNVRTYVTLEDRPGVYFFSLDASSALAVAGARALFGLPYYVARMRIDTGSRPVTPADSDSGADPAHEHDVWYRSRRLGARRPATFTARYRPTGPARAPEPGSLEHFLTERYCLYTVDRQGRASRLEIHHPPWPLQPAGAEIVENTMAAAAGIPLPADPPVLHFAARQDMVAWRAHLV